MGDIIKRVANALVAPAFLIAVWMVMLLKDSRNWRAEALTWAVTLPLGMLIGLTEVCIERFVPHRWPKFLRWIVGDLLALTVFGLCAFALHPLYRPALGGVGMLGFISGTFAGRDWVVPRTWGESTGGA